MDEVAERRVVGGIVKNEYISMVNLLSFESKRRMMGM